MNYRFYLGLLVAGMELITYQQLMGLSPSERALYIRETRALTVELEQLQQEQEIPPQVSPPPVTK